MLIKPLVLFSDLSNCSSHLPHVFLQVSMLIWCEQYSCNSFGAVVRCTSVQRPVSWSSQASKINIICRSYYNYNCSDQKFILFLWHINFLLHIYLLLTINWVNLSSPIVTSDCYQWYIIPLVFYNKIYA